MSIGAKGEEPRGLGVSRRSFLKGAGAAGLAASVFGATGVAQLAFADDAPETASAPQENEYLSIFGGEVSYLPVRKAEWSVESGPIGYEGREIAEEEISRTDECDFLVIGCGVSGIMGALEAAEHGAKVIAIEKMSKGRNMWESIGGCGSKSQAELNNTPDPAQYVEEILKASYWRARPDVAWSFVNNSGEAIDFMQDMLDKSEYGIKIQNTIQKESPYGFTVIQGEHKFEIPEKFNWTSWVTGPVVMSALTSVAEEHENIDLRLLTAGVQLTQDESGKVSGAIVKDGSGYYRINAAKGVLLATGSYDANPAMMQAWTRPEDYATSSSWNPCLGTTGDGHMMGLKVGADMDPVPHAVMNFNYGTPAQFLDIPGIFTCAALGIHVNASGKRFVNEGLEMNFVSNAINAQPGFGKNCWILFDQTIMEIQKASDPNTQATIDDYTEKGWLISAESLSDLAGKIDVSADSLENTVATYNSYFAAEAPSDLEFRRDLSSAAPLAEGPFYALTTNSTVLAVGGGLMINENAQVLDSSNSPIEGLYAAGNASGGMFSGTYPRNLPATSVGRSATFGYVAARHATKGE